MDHFGNVLVNGVAVNDQGTQNLLDSLRIFIGLGEQYNQLMEKAGAKLSHTKEDHQRATRYSAESLVELVKETPFLYDKFHPLYTNQRMRVDRWSEIGRKFNMPGPVVFKKWANIRDRYKRILNIVLQRRAKGEFFQPPWRFFNLLHKMLRHIYLTSEERQWLARSDGAVVTGQPLSPATNSDLSVGLSDDDDNNDTGDDNNKNDTSDDNTEDCNNDTGDITDNSDNNTNNNNNNNEDPVKAFMERINNRIRNHDRPAQLRLISAIDKLILDFQK